MKKIIIALVSMLVMVPVVLEAQNSSKEVLKQAKKTEKMFKKEGWKIFGSTSTLRDALVKHYEKMNKIGDGASEQSGTATVSDPKHKNLLVQAAETNAYASYAGKCREVVGQVVNEMELTTVEKDNFLATYKSTIQAKIKGELDKSFVIIREVSKDQIDAQVFFVVDDAAAERARLRALRVASEGMKITEDMREKLDMAAKQRIQ